jgi:hypothetical protein
MCLCVLVAVHTQIMQLSKENEHLKKDKETLQSTGSLLQGQLQTVQTKYDALASATQLATDNDLLTAKHRTSMREVLELQRKLQSAQVHMYGSLPLCQMLAPPHSLHLLLMRWCWQMLAPPHSFRAGAGRCPRPRTPCICSFGAGAGRCSRPRTPCIGSFGAGAQSRDCVNHTTIRE